ncbi:helix-turn-helix transcriptional regulator [Sorangium sp. So ce341]|uniref:helix-turn-helix transcriptional regulator n=1 Tax=Sorangium sp. So ce341 TaxID=3133302 RepID=UPI003F609334
MSQNVSLQLLHLAQRVRPRDAHVARAPDPALQALSPAAPLRALVAERARVGGLGAVFALGDGLDALTFSPTLYLLESAASVAQLAHRWSALERAWGVRHQTRFALDGAGALQLAAQPYAGALAPASQTVMITGVLAALLRRMGHGELVVAARAARGPWRELACDARWLGPASLAEPPVALRLAWSRRTAPVPSARLTLHPPSAADDPVAATLAAIEREPHAPWTPQGLAHATRQSVRTLQRRLAAHGTTASALARRVRARDATVAIAGSLRPLTEIAHAYGFSDAAHLARELRAASGMPPSAYRAVARTR